MGQDSSEKIAADEAERIYGVTCPHERMPNGELRFRLTSSDGSAYIKTVSTPNSGWQNSHYHKHVYETYIVQSGWMALASLRDGCLVIERFTQGDLVTTKLDEPHNVYLPADAVIHTVKHGYSEVRDWWPVTELDDRTKHLAEAEIIARCQHPIRSGSLDPRFGSYIGVYNNLDTLIWQVPGFFVGGAAIFFGFVASSFQSGITKLPSIAWGLLFLFVSALFLIGAYSMSRLRIHHSRMGIELKGMETMGYFHTRCTTVRKWWPPAAPHVFIAFFSVLGGFCLLISALILSKSPWLMSLVHP
jgi:mannose-6-phosphate isomerase-like protein (cupin superfamily)